MVDFYGKDSTDRVGMGAVLVFCSIRRVAESLAAPWILAEIRFFTRVGAQVSLEVLEPRVRFVAFLKLHSACQT